MLQISDEEDADSDEEDADKQVTQMVQREVLMHFGEHPLSKKESPLAWWKANQA